ncbi:MAG: acyl-CoA thioesterase [Thermoplasmata archaeon]
MAETSSLAPRSPDESRVHMLRLMLPADGNPMGTVFGAVILDQIDRAAYIASVRHAGGVCVTASIDGVDFLGPVRVGDIVHVTAQVSYVGRTSMEVEIHVEAERPGVPTLTTVGDAFVTMVAVDEARRPRPVAPLRLVTEEDRRRHDEGQKRAEERARHRAGRAGSRRGG